MVKQKKSGNSNVSNGQRPNVNKKIRNMVRKERLRNRPLEDLLQSTNFKQSIINSARTVKEKSMREKFLEEKRVNEACDRLMIKYEEAGLTRAEAVHAIKTDYVLSLEDKWLSRKKIWISQQQKKGKDSGKETTSFNAISK